MSTTSSNLPAIILGVVIAALLVGFYIVDRSSNAEVSSVAHSANTDDMISAKQKYETEKSVYSHSGYSGSLEDYLHHAKDNKQVDPSVKEHSGYTGSGKNYIEHHQAEENAAQIANVDEHRGFSGSVEDYMSGNYETHTGKKHHAKSSPSKSSSSHDDSPATTSYSGSVDRYLKKYGG